MTLVRKAFGFWKGQIVWFLKVAILLFQRKLSSRGWDGFHYSSKKSGLLFQNLLVKEAAVGKALGCGFIQSLWWVEAQGPRNGKGIQALSWALPRRDLPLRPPPRVNHKSWWSPLHTYPVLFGTREHGLLDVTWTLYYCQMMGCHSQIWG